MVPEPSVASTSFAFPISDADLNDTKQTKTAKDLPLDVSPEFGTCSETLKNGEPCTNQVNTAVSVLCSYHQQDGARKMRANRASLWHGHKQSKRDQLRSPKKKPLGKGAKSKKENSDQKASKTRFNPYNPAVASKMRYSQRQVQKLKQLRSEKENQEPLETKIPQVIEVKNEENSLKDFVEKQSKLSIFRQAANRAGAPKLGSSFQGDVLADLNL
ncbi:hypothetical protein M3Y98_01225900 [Aphelenchoides besseyi]|nr:hypothetical protein M3Y98_01225900 [Aphelenchoides besseyi]KAI6193386.1 hypothetical protein M3Y96_01012400 [Aphelenchoides besseyi]